MLLFVARGKRQEKNLHATVKGGSTLYSPQVLHKEEGKH